MKKTVSIIIPTFERQSYVAAIVQAIARQTVFPVQTIVVDQSSQNQAEAFPASVTYIHTTPCGPARARNLGAAQATGDVLLFVDDDGKIGDDFVEKHLRWYDHDFVDVVHGGVQQVGQPLPATPQLPVGASAADWLRLSPNCQRRQMCIGLASGNFSIRAELFRRVGGFDERFGRGEDKELGVRLFQAGAVILYDPEPLFVHLRAPGGTRRTGSPSFFEGFFRPEPHPGEYLLYLKHWPGWQARCWVLSRVSQIWAWQNLKRLDLCLLRTIRLYRCIMMANEAANSN